MFLSLDLFLFYFFFEMMLIPMYFVIALWGHERRVYAAIKFFIFTQASGLLMLIAILALYFIHGRATGVYTFDFTQLLGTPMPSGTAFLLMLGFFAAFAVKLPAFPLHTWLPDAHTEAPTAGSRDPRRRAHQDRRLRDDPLHGAALPAGRRTTSAPSAWSSP